MHATLYRVPALATFVPVLEQLAPHWGTSSGTFSATFTGQQSPVVVRVGVEAAGEEARGKFAAAGSELWIYGMHLFCTLDLINVATALQVSRPSTRAVAKVHRGDSSFTRQLLALPHDNSCPSLPPPPALWLGYIWITLGHKNCKSAKWICLSSGTKRDSSNRIPPSGNCAYSKRGYSCGYIFMYVCVSAVISI